MPNEMPTPTDAQPVWHARPSRRTDSATITEDGHTVALVFPDVSLAEGDSALRRANLMAAAPKLVAALEKVMAAYETYHNAETENEELYPYTLIDVIGLELPAAIALAKGGPYAS